MKAIRQTVCAVLLALFVALGTTASAQIPPKSYWSCGFWWFWTGPYSQQIVENLSDPTDIDYFTGTGWQCIYLATCYYTQDINGNVQEFCN